MYGCFELLRQVGSERSLFGINRLFCPDNLFRMYNHWDNMDGSIERGYSGKSFFFSDNQMLLNERTRDYARLVSSVGRTVWLSIMSM